LSAPFLSVVIPAHNEERRIPSTLENVIEFLNSQPYSSEVVAVENASSDGTWEILQAAAAQTPAIRLAQEPRRGKGMAVRRGVETARGEYIFICDADLSMPISEVNRFLPPQLTGADVAIGSREGPGAQRFNEPHYRHLVGRVFNAMVKLVALPGLQDTQCGFKCFRREVARDVFAFQTIGGWGFDVEVLFVARKRGYRIAEVPIPWYFNPESHIRVMRDSFRMALDLLTIRLNAIRGRYNAKV
jgi:dolichyl-phosphate beta-glucosyltransferase